MNGPGSPAVKVPPGRLELAGLGAAVAAALALRLHGIGAKGLWLDELGQAFVARGGPLAAVRDAAHHVAAAPLDYLVTSVVLLFGSSETALRLPAALWGTASVAVLFFLARRVSGRDGVALAAASLLAVCPMHVRYSQEVRFYALFGLLSLASLLAILRALDGGRRRDWAVAGGLLAASFLAHYYTVLVAASALGFALSSRRHRPAAGRLLGVTALSAVPIALFTLHAHGGAPSRFRFEAPRVDDVLVWAVAGEDFPTPRDVAVTRFATLGVLPALAGAGVAAAALGARSRLLAVAATVLLSTAGVLLLDWRFSYFWAPRQLLFVVPLWLLLAAEGASALAALLARGSRAVAAALLSAGTAGVVLGLVPGLIGWNGAPKENWRAAGAVLGAELASGRAQLVGDPSASGRTGYLSWYSPGLAATGVSGEAFRQAVTAGTAPERAWLVEDPAYVATLQRSLGWSAIDLTPAPGFHLSYLGGVPQETLVLELAGRDPRPELLVHGGFLQRLAALDRALALRTARRAVARVEAGDHFLLDPELAWLYTSAGRFAFDAGSVEEARTLLARAVSLDGRNVEALNNLGLVALRGGSLAQAERAFRRSSRLDPRGYWAHALLAETLLAAGREREARREAERAAALKPR